MQRKRLGDPEWSRRQQAQFLRNHPGYKATIGARRSRLKAKYGITLEQWETMFEDQEGKCAMCQTHQSELKHRLCVDHDHITEVVRGLLCRSCNMFLGLFEKGMGEWATEYLETCILESNG